MQARDERESRFVHDQLATMAPLMLALSASTPIFKGHLAGTGNLYPIRQNLHFVFIHIHRFMQYTFTLSLTHLVTHSLTHLHTHTRSHLLIYRYAMGCHLSIGR
jgi:gamma-glutamyl:cysteine ligase YbdK (ATP-grasp superfamily)